MLYHNSRAPECRAPMGAVRTGSPVRFRLFGTDRSARVSLIITALGRREMQPMYPAGDDCHEIRVLMPDTPCIFQYFFHVQRQFGGEEYYGNAWDGLGGEGTPSGPEPIPFQVTVYAADYQTPEYLHGGVMYQIFPDRFYAPEKPRSNRTNLYLHDSWEDVPLRRVTAVKEEDNYSLDFFGGSLRGIEEKLPYLSDLGVTVIYLNPIFQARSNHRYDTGDYLKIDPMLGTQEDFERLCRSAERCHIRVMLDGVFSHTGTDSRYFNYYGHYGQGGAYRTKDSRYYSWYKFDRWPDDYKSWWGIKTLPELNKDDPSVRAYFLGEHGVVRRWLHSGASAWRLDVADELPMSYLRQLRQSARTEKPDAAVLGEVWEDASHKVSYGEMRSYCLGDTLDSVMNYPLRSAVIDWLLFRSDAYRLCRVIESQQENYAPPFYYSLMNLMGSHDRPRVLSLLCREVENDDDHEPIRKGASRAALARGKQRVLVFMRLLCVLPGIVSVYYGDECGMRGSADPYCRGTYPWGRGDEAMLNEIRDILAIRKRPVIRVGRMTVRAQDADTLIIRREISAGHDAFGRPAEDDVFEWKAVRPAL